MRAALLASLACVGALAACVPAAPVDGSPRVEARPLPIRPVTFEYASLDDRAVSTPAFRGKPAILAFVVSDTLAGQAEATILGRVATRESGRVSVAVVAVEPPERRELVAAFARFFTDAPALRFAMADADALAGAGPFGDVRALTVAVLDAAGHVVLLRSGLVQEGEIAQALATR